MRSSLPPPPSIAKHGITHASTNREPDQEVILNPKTVVLLFGDQLLELLRQRQAATPNPE